MFDIGATPAMRLKWCSWRGWQHSRVPLLLKFAEEQNINVLYLNIGVRKLKF